MNIYSRASVNAFAFEQHVRELQPTTGQVFKNEQQAKGGLPCLPALARMLLLLSFTKILKDLRVNLPNWKNCEAECLRPSRRSELDERRNRRDWAHRGEARSAGNDHQSGILCLVGIVRGCLAVYSCQSRDNGWRLGAILEARPPQVLSKIISGSLRCVRSGARMEMFLSSNSALERSFLNSLSLTPYEPECVRPRR